MPLAAAPRLCSSAQRRTVARSGAQRSGVDRRGAARSGVQLVALGHRSASCAEQSIAAQSGAEQRGAAASGSERRSAAHAAAPFFAPLLCSTLLLSQPPWEKCRTKNLMVEEGPPDFVCHSFIIL